MMTQEELRRWHVEGAIRVAGTNYASADVVSWVVEAEREELRRRTGCTAAEMRRPDGL
jgi:hypothetical protein